MSEGQNGVQAVPDSLDSEVTPKAKRRIYTSAYKKKILAEVDAAAGSGNIGEILRREGIYSSTLTGWRKERDAAHRILPEAWARAETQSVDFRE